VRQLLLHNFNVSPIHAAWNDKRPDRPWIAILKRTAKSMTVKDWLIFFGIVAAFTLVGFMGKHRGTLFSDEAPKWATRFVMGLTFGCLFAAMARLNRFGFRTLAPAKPALPGSWTSVVVELGNRMSLMKIDSGSAVVVRGRLFFSGEHSSFQVSLSEIEISKIDKAAHSVTVWIPNTRQRLKISSNTDDEVAWPTFVADLIQSTRIPGSESVYPPKVTYGWIGRVAVLFGVILLVEAIALGAWSIAKSTALPLYPTFIALEALFLSFAFLLALQIDLRLWNRRRLKLSDLPQT
jgi:hypothetical protein